jgi:uncharacterized protein YwqG/predicted DNA-binding protein (MmcQ/YjbR family)
MDVTLVDRIRAYCHSKPQAEENTQRFGENRPAFYLLGAIFASFYLSEAPVQLSMPCDKEVFAQFQTSYRTISVSKRMKWDRPTWQWIVVLLDNSVPEAQVKALVDHAYDLVIERELTASDRRLIELRAMELTEQEALPKVVELVGLEHKLEEISRLLKPAIQLVTYPSRDEQLRLGQTKLGGLPDLPSGWEWPISNDRHLAFLAQINLGDIPDHIDRLALPSSGILYFFSHWGRLNYDEDILLLNENDPAFSEVLHFTGDTSDLQRRRKHGDVEPFKTAAVRFVPIQTLPSAHPVEPDPALAKMRWTKQEFDQCGELPDAFRYVMGYPGKDVWNFPAHQVLGYASPIQGAVTTANTDLLFQLDTYDQNTDMMIADGGVMYFTIDREGLARGDFAAARGELQSS